MFAVHRAGLASVGAGLSASDILMSVSVVIILYAKVYQLTGND